MRVELTTTISGTRNGQPWPPKGTLVDLPGDEAATLVASGAAKPADITETAEAVPAGETADAPVKSPAKKAAVKKSTD